MLFNSLFLSLDTPLNLEKKFSKPAVSKSNAIIFFPEIKKFEVLASPCLKFIHLNRLKKNDIPDVIVSKLALFDKASSSL